DEERRKTAADLAAKQREEEAQQKAASAAEAKRKADEALAKAQADRQRAEEAAARQRAEGEATAKAEAAAKAEADPAMQQKSAEAAESALNLTLSDRQRLQVALSSLGFGTRGNDGVLGPRSREAIAAWQRARNLPATGFVDANQLQTLLREGAEAIRSFEREQKKADEDRKRSEEAPNKTTALRPDAGIGGRWVDNWGAVYSAIQAGDRYYFTASGQACRGPYTSQGTGVIAGSRVEVSYRSTYSVGSCIGTISADGNRITSDCRDSACGPFRTTLERR